MFIYFVLILNLSCFRLNSSGVIFVEKNVNSLKELFDYDLIMNCSGFGARELCNDRHMVPIRGQVTKVRFSQFL